MAKTSKKNNDNTIIDEKIFQQNITDTLELNYMPYAMSVIVSRAIPEIDGFKPSHRKLLYTMYKVGLINGDRTKSSNVVGQTMKLNPHGDGAIYETLVRLTEGNAALLHPFIDSKGNFGKQFSRDMAYAAPRYTEVKLSKICQEIFADIDKNTVDFIDNYDSTTKEPVLLPTTFPNILVSPNQGIAVGMASTICSFNLNEICTATTKFIKNENIDLLEHLKAPDFPTGGALVYNETQLRQIYETGRGSFKVRAKYTFDAKNSCIDITEIPYTTNIEAIIDKIIQLVKLGKIKDIVDVRDETDLNGLKITIDIKKSAEPIKIMHKLYSSTPLEDSFSCNFNILIDGRPKTLGIKSILHEWVNFRVGSIKKQISYDIQKKTDKYHLLEGLAKILMDIDKAISIIRHTELESMVVPNLMMGFDIDDRQAEFIAEIKLRNINKEYIINRVKEIDTLKNEIADLKETFNSETKVKDIICSQLKYVSKTYGKPRFTEIISAEDIVEISSDDLIEDYPIKLFLTKGNYFKKITVASLRSSSEQKLKEDDVMLVEVEATNKSEILLFSDKANVYKVKASDIADCKASSLGDYLNNVLSMDEDENIIYFCATIDYSGNMLFAFDNGKMAKVPLSSYQTKVNRKKLINAYCAKFPLIYMTKIDEDQDIFIVRDSDKASVVNTSLVPVSVTKNAVGLKVFHLKLKSNISKIGLLDEFVVQDKEYYRANKIPTPGHFILERDKADFKKILLQ